MASGDERAAKSRPWCLICLATPVVVNVFDTEVGDDLLFTTIERLLQVRLSTDKDGLKCICNICYQQFSSMVEVIDSFKVAFNRTNQLMSSIVQDGVQNILTPDNVKRNKSSFNIGLESTDDEMASNDEDIDADDEMSSDYDKDDDNNDIELGESSNINNEINIVDKSMSSDNKDSGIANNSDDTNQKTEQPPPSVVTPLDSNDDDVDNVIILIL